MTRLMTALLATTTLIAATPAVALSWSDIRDTIAEDIREARQELSNDFGSDRRIASDDRDEDEQDRDEADDEDDDEDEDDRDDDEDDDREDRDDDGDDGDDGDDDEDRDRD